MNRKMKTGLLTALGITAGTAAAYGITKVVQSVTWFHNYCKLVDYPLGAVKNSPLEEKGIKLIAHRGYRAVAPENTLPAYLKAGEAHFWGAECDVYRTKDGVWVLHHDPLTYRMMNKTKNPEKCTYEELLGLHYTNGHNIQDYPDLKITRLEEFYQVCKDYGMHAVVEIKYDRSAAYMKELVDMAESFGVETTFIAFEFVNLQELRKYTDAPLFFLVYDIKDSDIEKAKTLENCGISFDGNDERNLQNNCEMVRKCRDAGLDTATWAVDDMDIIRQIADTGTQYITTNSVTYE